MQEEIEQKTINLCISTTRLTARTLLNVGRAYLRHQQGTGPHGKQSVKSLQERYNQLLEEESLLRQNRGVSSLEIGSTGIRGFERYARRYGIDYAIRKDSTETPPRYLVFFKAPDAEAMNAALKEYAGFLKEKPQRPSVLARLQELVQAAAELPGKVRHKEQERGL